MIDHTFIRLYYQVKLHYIVRIVKYCLHGFILGITQLSQVCHKVGSGEGRVEPCYEPLTFL